MSKTKKILTTALAMALAAQLSATAFAAIPGTDGKYGTEDDRGTLTVQGIDYESGITVEAYRIIEPKYENGGSFSGYAWLVDPDGTGPITVGTKITEDLDVTEEQMNAIIAGGYASLEKVTLNHSSGNYVSGDAKVGSYLVLIKGAETVVYNPVVDSIQYVAVENADGDTTGNTLSSGMVDVRDGSVWVKKSTVPTVDKEATKVTDGSGKNSPAIKTPDASGNDVQTAKPGDTVEFTIMIDPIPNYGGDHPTLNIVDTLSEGLEYKDGLKVEVLDKTVTPNAYIALNEDYYSATAANQSVNVDFVITVSGVKHYYLNDYAGSKIRITYNATVTDDAVMNDSNDNTVVLTYAKDSKTAGGDGTDSDKTRTYTFDIDGSIDGSSVTQEILTKIGDKETVNTTVNKKALAGAEFTLYLDDPDTTTSPRVFSNTVFDGTVSSDENGQLNIKGLEKGTYYLKETKAPAGYSLNTHVYTIVVNYSTKNDTTDKTVKGYELDTWEITIDGNKTSTFSTTNGVSSATTITKVDIPNTSLTSLPSTGGIGTTLFTILGCITMVFAVAMILYINRKPVNK